MLKKIFNDRYIYFIIVIVISIIIIKIPHLFLPYYWDEAWIYSFAINFMYEHGLSLLPGAIPPDLSTGHPLLFYFLEALWMKIFGTSLLAAKAFPLLISVCLLFSLYFFCKKFFNRLTGAVAVIVFASQEIFLSQSSFMLPEMLLTLLTITSLYFFFSKRIWLFIISSFLLTLTKESGMLLVMLLIFWQFITFITKRNYALKFTNPEFTLLIAAIIPLLLISLYYVIQKYTYGWYFFPRHFNWITFKWVDFKRNFYEYLFYQLFIDTGKNIMSIVFLISLIYYLLKKFKPKSAQLYILIFLAFFVIASMLFTSINFIAPRYILCVFPIFIIIYSYFILAALRKYKILTAIIFITIIGVKLYFTYTDRNELDTNLGFADAVMVHKKVISYCEKSKLEDKKIYTHFLMLKNLTSPVPGYLSDKNNIFKNVTNQDEEFKNSDYCIFSCMEYDPKYDKFKKENNVKLIFRAEKNYAWSEVYQIFK